MAPAEGTQAPDFELSGVRLSELRGSQVVLYFYPKDDTPGCTVQACGIRDSWQEFRDRGALVFGVSPDDEDSHGRFRDKFALPFTLLADTELEVTKAYGILRDGGDFPERATFVIGADGNVKRVFRKVDPASHTDDVLAALDL